MSADPVFAPPPPGRMPRVEYLDFQNVAGHREYRLALYGPDGRTEFRFRIAMSAFGAGRARLQDGADICYQRLLRAVLSGETASPDLFTIDDAELARYREAHTHVPKHRARPPVVSSPATAVRPPPPPPPRRPPSPTPSVAPPAPSDAPPALDEGQRVSHAVYGVGVTASSSGGHTVIRFDEDGPKTFITSMLELKVLSAPHTWETTPRGKNRPRLTR